MDLLLLAADAALIAVMLLMLVRLVRLACSAPRRRFLAVEEERPPGDPALLPLFPGLRGPAEVPAPAPASADGSVCFADQVLVVWEGNFVWDDCQITRCTIAVEGPVPTEPVFRRCRLTDCEVRVNGEVVSAVDSYVNLIGSLCRNCTIEHSGAGLTFHSVDPEAEARGEALLRRHLAPEQLRDYNERGCFTCAGGSTGKRYRVWRDRPNYNVEDLSTGARICFEPSRWLVRGDVLLAQKMALECDEEAALVVANTMPSSAFEPAVAVFNLLDAVCAGGGGRGGSNDTLYSVEARVLGAGGGGGAGGAECAGSE